MAAERSLRTPLSSWHYGISILLVSSFLAGQTHGGENTQICDPNQIKQNAAAHPGPAKPPLPGQFTVRVECNLQDKKTTIDIHEIYDNATNRGTIIQWSNGTKTKMIFDFKNNELVTLTYPKQGLNGGIPTCKVEDLSKSPKRFFFGITTSLSGSEHIASPSAALKFGGGHQEMYVGTERIRDGTIADVWRSCWYLPGMDGTFVVEWAFTASNWTSALGVGLSVPVQLKISGTVNKPSTRTINHLYEFTDFKPYLLYGKTGTFQTDPGTYCEGRAVQRHLPNVTNRFRFESEMVEQTNYYVNWIKEYYDFDLGLVRYDYKPDPKNPSQFGSNLMYRVHDFYSGVAYNIDPMIGNCTVTTIDKFGFDAKSKDFSHVRMRTKSEFFYFNKAQYKFEYAGKRLMRDIDCDVFVGLRNDFPPGYSAAPQTIWEWYFASSEWMESVGYLYEFALPVRLQITCPDDPSLNIIYNIYNYDEDNPRIYKTDISDCFNSSSQHIIQFAFPGTFEKDVSRDLEGFKLAVMQQIVSTCMISPLRINRMQVDYDQSGIIISFTLLDKPPISGNTDTSATEVMLGDAIARLRQTITSSQFIVALNPSVFKGVKPLTATMYSSNDDVVVNYYYGKKLPPTGYASGSMIGLGFGMVIVSFIIGFASWFGFKRFRSLGGVPVEGLGFEPRTYENVKEIVKENASEEC